MTTVAPTRARVSALERAARAEARAKEAEAKVREQFAKLRAKQAEGIAQRVRKMSHSGSYVNAGKTRLKAGVHALRGGSDDHLDAVTHDRLRGIAQHLVRNSPLARGMLKRLALCVTGGTGIRPQAATVDGEWNKRAEALFARWARPMGGCDVRRMRSFWQLQNVWLRSVLRDGDGGIVTLAQKSLQFVESERVGNVSTDLKSDRVNGVLLSAAGAPVSFRVRVAERGSTYSSKYEDIAARDMIWLVNPENDYASATRGEPLLAAAVGKFDDIDEFTDSTIIAARMATMLALMIKKANPADAQAAMLGEINDAEDGPSGSTQREEVWSPGSIMHLGVDETVEQVTPEHPTQQFEPFVRAVLRQVGADIGQPLEMAMLDFSQSNFYGNRAAMVTAWIGVAGLQQWFIDSCLSPLWEWFIRLTVDDGELEAREDMLEHRWVPKPMPAIDEEAEYKAKGMGMALKLISHKEAVERSGGDQLALFEDIEREQAEMKARGIVPAMVQGVVGQSATLPHGQSGKEENGRGGEELTEEQKLAAGARNLTEMVQKVYLGVNKVLTADEAREILNRAGAKLPDGFEPVLTDNGGAFGSPGGVGAAADAEDGEDAEEAAGEVE